jgi:hypothetical protein
MLAEALLGRWGRLRAGDGREGEGRQETEKASEVRTEK